MRICFFAQGSAIHTRRWINYFAERGHDVHLITFEPVIEGYNKSVKIYNLLRIFPNLWPITRFVSGIIWPFQVLFLFLKKIKPDILGAISITINGYLAVASGFHPLILTACGSDILIAPKKNYIWRFLTIFTLRKADALIFAAPHMAETAITLAGDIIRDRIYRDSFGSIDLEKFNPTKRGFGIREKLNLDNNCFVIISTRNLRQIYDVDTLIKSAPIVIDKIPKTYFIIIGDGEKRGKLEKLSEDLNVKNNIKFLGFIPHEDLPKYLTAADIYVSTSLSDGTSVSLLEAMGCELVPVVTDIPANQDWIKQGVNGFLVPIRDHNALANKIIYLLENEEKRKTFGIASREIVEEKSDYYKQMAEIEKIYEDLVCVQSRK
ncbi:hypothetical protein HY02_04290 [Peptococcaceae bacterium SCADC1_2_3]|nr:hypothetical protein DK28_0214090 [Peptococcaceae bacterium SCADC1_2_3]KFI37698.1 hypothetical protein HY02_04290 [Peptococcaceae bacterium SCADC1_2_3]